MATNVHDLCVQREITLEQLAERSGLELTRVQSIYLGRWTPSPAEREKIATVFELESSEVTWGHKTPIQHIYGHGPG
jgi:transcriptional regulator with XRE-family HTH domain